MSARLVEAKPILPNLLIALGARGARVTLPKLRKALGDRGLNQEPFDLVDVVHFASWVRRCVQAMMRDVRRRVIHEKLVPPILRHLGAATQSENVCLFGRAKMMTKMSRRFCRLVRALAGGGRGSMGHSHLPQYRMYSYTGSISAFDKLNGFWYE